MRNRSGIVGSLLFLDFLEEKGHNAAHNLTDDL